jgi:hypothetical protein
MEDNGGTLRWIGRNSGSSEELLRLLREHGSILHHLHVAR